MPASYSGPIVAIVVGALLGTASTALAQFGPARPSAGAFIPVQQPRPEQPPSSPRFNLRPREQAMLELRRQMGALKPKNVCGMTVVPAPKIDPKALKKAPEDKKYTMRSLPRTEFGWPASCESSEPAPTPDDTRTGR